jgi:hypothetical protein
VNSPHRVGDPSVSLSIPPRFAQQFNQSSPLASRQASPQHHRQPLQIRVGESSQPNPQGARPKIGSEIRPIFQCRQQPTQAPAVNGFFVAGGSIGGSRVFRFRNPLRINVLRFVAAVFTRRRSQVRVPCRPLDVSLAETIIYGYRPANRVTPLRCAAADMFRAARLRDST